PARHPRSTASSISARGGLGLLSCVAPMSNASPPQRSRACASSRSRVTSSSASVSSPPTLGTRAALVFATVLGAGYSPFAPGTAGSAVALLILWLVPFSRLGLVVFFVVVTLVGTWAAHVAEAAIGTKDPGAIVI